MSYRKDFILDSGVLTLGGQFRLPVIASDVGQIGACVKAYGLGLTFSAEDSGSLRKAILTFLNLREKEKLAIQEGMAKFARFYSWDKIAQTHLTLYKELG